MSLQLLKRVRAARERSAQIAQAMWMNFDVPVEMVVRQSRITIRWDDVGALLSGADRSVRAPVS